MDELLARARDTWRVVSVRARRGLRAAGDWLAAQVALARARWASWRLERAERRETAGRAAPAPARAASRRAPATPQELGASILVGPRDDETAVIGRIDTANDVEVVLVVPRSARELRRPGAWAHIAAYSRRRGLNVRVVAARRDVRAHAQTHGLAAARGWRGLPGAGQRRLRLAEYDVALPDVPWGLALRTATLLLGVGAIVGVACYTVPSAEIVVVPPTQPVSERATVRVNPLVLEPDVSTGVIPGSTVRRTVTTIVSTSTTGTTLTGATPAVVELNFTNEGATPIEVAGETEVRDDSGVVFTTDARVIVPAGEVVTVSATAATPGTASNLEAGMLTQLSGLPAALTATNPAAAAGGTDTEVPAVAQEDVDRVGEIADEVFQRIGARELEEEIAGGRVFAETLTVAVFSQTPLQEVEEPAQAFLMEYTVVVTALGVTEASARAYGEALLLSRLAEGATLLPGLTQVRFDRQTAFEGGQLSVDLVATGLVTQDFEPAELRGQLTGVRPEIAAERLQAMLQLETTPLVTIKPEWLPWIWTPRRDSRITIVLEAPPAAPAISDALPLPAQPAAATPASRTSR